MKQIHSFFILFIFMVNFGNSSAQSYYEKQWKTMETNSSKGLYKTNLSILQDIEKQALKEQNTLELVKALKVELSILNRTKNDENNNIYSDFLKKIQSIETQSKGHSKLLVKILKNEFLIDYYYNNNWKINNRTNIAQSQSDIETWTTLDFKNSLLKNYIDLEKDKTIIQKIKMLSYKSLFNNDDNIDYFPSIWEWNTLNYIDFLKNNSFFTEKEIKNNSIKIKSLFDDLIYYNTGNSKLYFQNKSIQYQCEMAHCDDKTALLTELYQSKTLGDYKVLIAEKIIENLIDKELNTEAISWITRVKKEYPNSTFLSGIKNLENNIKSPEISLDYTKENISNKPIHISVKAKNINHFSLNIYKISDEKNILRQINNQHTLKKSLVKKLDFQLNLPNDYKLHRTSLEIPPLPAGSYIAEYKNKKETESFLFYTNDFQIITYKNNNNVLLLEYQLVNRESGQKMADETLEFYHLDRNNTLQKNIIKTDKQGVFTFPKTKINNHFINTHFLIKTKTKGYCDYNLYGYIHQNTEKHIEQNIQIFLDREIYRPGQVVYFKVINTLKNMLGESVVSNEQQTIKLIDPNGKEIDKQIFKTNEFGSYSGYFTLPQNHLNGHFHFSINGKYTHQTKHFSVEEYKKPQFEITFQPLKDAYKFGQIIEIKGNAKSFSGIPLNKVKVNYEIKKKDISWKYYIIYEENNNQDTTLGETLTDEKGNFTIILHPKKDKKGIQVHQYNIKASITDINGETQSDETNISVASVSHYIDIETEIDNFSDNEEVKFNIGLKNYNGSRLEKTYTAKLEKLKGYERLYRSNFENVVQDLPALSRAEFEQKFPYDRYEKEKKSVEKILYEKQNTATKDEQYQINLGKISAGRYRLILYNIENGDTIKAEKYFDIWDKKGLAKGQKPFLKVYTPKTTINRGEVLKLYIYTAIPNAVVDVFSQNMEQERIHKTLFPNNGVAVYEVSAPKNKNVALLNLQFRIVALGDVQTHTQIIKIHNDNEKLTIRTTTFRDKITPNKKETWSVNISGKKQIEAELLANMYDMSLDQFKTNHYSWKTFYNKPKFPISHYGVHNAIETIFLNRQDFSYLSTSSILTPLFNWFDGDILLSRRISEHNKKNPPYQTYDLVALNGESKPEIEESVVSYMVSNQQPQTPSKNENQFTRRNPIRENLKETAFFYPHLHTDNNGNILFEFTSPEALTKWKLMLLAHTKDGKGATLEQSVITQKEFSINPNYPRFLREGDEIHFQTKLNNLTYTSLNGMIRLQILDAINNEDISEKFGLSQNKQTFSIDKENSNVVSWAIKVPHYIGNVIFKILAEAGNYTDGEQKGIAILPNRTLVTEALPIFVKEGETKTFSLTHLAENKSNTIQNFATTLELNTNPIWDIIFALPSLKNNQNFSTDVVFNKWFADVLAMEIFNANPKVKAIFEEYQNKGLIQSKLTINQELKQVLLQETPWVLDSQNEQKQMEQLVALFDANTMTNSLSTDWQEFLKLQNSDGGFSWHQGYPSNYYTSLYILKSLGKIKHWVGNKYQGNEHKILIEKLIGYIDQEMNKQWKYNEKQVWNNIVFDYLDARHYWEKEYPLKDKGLSLKQSVMQKAKKASIKDFTFFGLHRAALLFHHYKLSEISKKLLTYLKETSTESKTQGVYWKQNLNDWGWYSSKIFNHSGAIEAFQKLAPNDNKFIEAMKIWLITQKEVNAWSNSRETAEVIFTIINSGNSWISNNNDKTEIKWGNQSTKPQIKSSGYLKQRIISEVIDPKLAFVTIKKEGSSIVQGGLFWQYYEDLDKVKLSENYLSITKELYKKVKTETGEILQKITNENALKVGDKVTARIILNTDRTMSFVHIKDMRAAGFEPINILSGYKWQETIHYYESIKDTSTNFYIEHLPKGKYVFEHDYICSASGQFSNGITTLQNYYAPQMKANSKGELIKINQN